MLLTDSSMTQSKKFCSIYHFLSNFIFLKPSFQRNATRLSRLMRDELMPAKDIGVYWIEHILRHKGGKHLQLAGKDMPFHQRYLLDVLAFLIGISAVFLISLGIIIRRVWSRYLRRAPASTEKFKIPQTVSKKVKNRKRQL